VDEKIVLNTIWIVVVKKLKAPLFKKRQINELTYLLVKTKHNINNRELSI
jgi:hypothetical protein